MTLTDRQYALLQRLRRTPDTAVAALSQEMDLAPQTIRQDVNALMPLFRRYGVECSMEEGQLHLAGKNNLELLLRESRTALTFSVQKKILLVLLLEQKYTTLQEIADVLYLSRSKIDKELPALLKEYPQEIRSRRHYGLSWCGTWSQRFRCFVQLLEPYMQGMDFPASLRKFNDIHFPLFRSITEEQIQTAQKVLEAVGQNELFSLTDASQRQLFLHLLLLQRMQAAPADALPVMPDVPEFFRLAENDELWQLADQIDREFALFASTLEKSYFYYVLLSLPKVYREPGMAPVQETEPVIHRILEELLQLYAMDLRADTELIRGLKQHIYAVILRRDQIDPPFLDEDSAEDLRRQYPLAMELAATAANRIGLLFHYTVPTNEIPLLALHFQLALERRKAAASKIRCCVVCHFGMAASNLICGRIEQSYPELMVTATYSYQEFCNLKQYDFDVVLSTETLPVCGVPVIYISLGKNRWEEEQIERFVQEYRVGHTLKPLIENAVILHLHAEDAADAIRQIGGWLEQNDCVQSGYTESVLQREQISPTELKYIAVPHGNPQLVNATTLVIGRLDKPLRWCEETISTIFLFACTQQTVEDKNNVFSSFFRKLAEPSTEQAIHDLIACGDDEYRKRLTDRMVD